MPPRTTNRRLVGALFAALLLLGLCGVAHAKKGTIRLFAASDTYTPGKPVTMYVYFFRVSSMGFWRQNITDVPDFRVTSRKRISARVERFRDPNGSPFPLERQHLVYRVQLMPRSQAKVLRYGPLRLSFQVGSFAGFRRVTLRSNVLTFRRSKPSPKGGKIETKLVLPKAPITEGLPFYLHYEVHCPTSLCNYQKLGHDRLIQILQKRVRLSVPRSLSIPQKKIAPAVLYRTQAQPPKTIVRFRYKVFALRKGTLRTPSLRVSLPVLNVVDQRPVLTGIQKWLKSKGIPSTRVAGYVQLDRDVHASLTLRKLSFAAKDLKAQASRGLQGQWQLSSKLVNNGGKVYWKVSMEGKGFLRSVVGFFRKQLTDALTRGKLDKALALAHLTWELADGRPDGQIGLHAFFSFKGQRPALPALKMQFVDASGKRYARTTAAIAANASPTVSDTTPMQGNRSDRHIYIHHYAAPTVGEAQQVTVWGVKLPEGFPTKDLLAQRWKYHTTLDLKEQQVGQVHRSYSRRVQDPFTGSITYMQYSGPSPVKALVGHAQVSVRSGIMARFPAVRWGNRWFFHHRKASKASKQGLQLRASTDRKRYFVGEKVEYTLRLSCPKRLCTAPLRNFIKEQMLQKFKLLKLPSFSQFAEPRVLERFKQYDAGEAIEFRYRVRFKAPTADQFKIKAATFRLPRRFLYHILRKFQACLYPEGGSQSLLFRLVAKDHYQRDVNNDGRCSIGTQVLTSAALNIPIETLPDQAKGIQLIGSFRIEAKLSQMTFPNKNATIKDKPFYLNVTIAGDGDLKTARELLRDQLTEMGRRLRKRNVTSYIETPADKDQSLTLQVQLIGEEVGTFQIPSLKLKHYHREEGVLTAQTLPIKVEITPRTGGNAAIPVARRPAGKRKRRILQQTTDLRPNLVLGARLLGAQDFSMGSWQTLLLLLGGPGLFLFFLGWHQFSLRRDADPQRIKRNRAMRHFSQAIGQVSFSGDGGAQAAARATIDALQTYLIERLSLSQKQLTPGEIETLLQPHAESASTQEATKGILGQLEQLEASLYGGDAIGAPQDFLQQLERHVRALDRTLPKSGTTTNS